MKYSKRLGNMSNEEFGKLMYEKVKNLYLQNANKGPMDANELTSWIREVAPACLMEIIKEEEERHDAVDEMTAMAGGSVQGGMGGPGFKKEGPFAEDPETINEVLNALKKK